MAGFCLADTVWPTLAQCFPAVISVAEFERICRDPYFRLTIRVDNRWQALKYAKVTLTDQQAVAIARDFSNASLTFADPIEPCYKRGARTIQTNSTQQDR